MNILILSGRIGKGGTTVREHNGRTFLTFDLCEDTGYSDRDGNWQARTRWHNCVIWNGSEKMAQNMPQGRHVTLHCELDYNEYTSQGGEKHKRARIKLDMAKGHRVEFGPRAAHVTGDDAPVDMGDILPDEEIADPAPPSIPAGTAAGKGKRSDSLML